jgi:hypothetical protein
MGYIDNIDNIDNEILWDILINPLANVISHSNFFGKQPSLQLEIPIKLKLLR